MKRLIFDLDGTICFATNGDYVNASPNQQVIDEDNADAEFLDADRLVKTLKLGKKDAMYISVIQQLLTKIETLETKVAALEAA